MRIAWIGSRKTRTLRNRILKKGLIENNVEIVDFSIPAEFSPYTSKPRLATDVFLRFLKSLSMNFNSLKPSDCEFILCTYPSQDILPLIYPLLKKTKTPIVFDPFISVYYSYTQDYDLLNPKSLPARFLYAWEQQALKHPNLVLAETNVMCDFFSKAYKIPRDRFRRAFLGADDSLFNPEHYRNTNTNEEQAFESKTKSEFIVSFIGEFIPSQGIQYILQAGKNLKEICKKSGIKDISIKMIGALPRPFEIAKQYVRKNELDNVEIVPYIPIEHVPGEIAESDIQLGIFGMTPKAKMVISNKVVCAAAMGKPIITGESNASKELFTHGKDIWFTEFGNGKMLADSIIALYEDEKTRKHIGIEAKKRFDEYLTPKVIVKSILTGFKNDFH